MSTSRRDNTERNARIIGLACQGKAPAEIARELGISRGVVSGVIRRARDSGKLPKAQPSRVEESREPLAAPSIGNEESRLSEIEETRYKNSQDPYFIDAAQNNILSLRECIIWINRVLKKMEIDENYKNLMYLINDPRYELQLAQSYIEMMNKDMDCLENPDESTPQQRHDARMRIAQVRSWALEWDKGAGFRDKLYGDLIPPSLSDAYPVTYPSVISTISVPAEVRPGYDPFADNQ